MTRLTASVEDWREQGLCRQYDPDTFFGKTTPDVHEAKRICRGCPVREQCTQFALDNDERFGVWGGLSQKELRALRSRRKQAIA